MNEEIVKHEQEQCSHLIVYPLFSFGNCYLSGICLDCGNFVSVNLVSKSNKSHVLLWPLYPSIEHYFAVRKIYQENKDILFLNQKINEQNRNIRENMVRRLKIKDVN